MLPTYKGAYIDQEHQIELLKILKQDNNSDVAKKIKELLSNNGYSHKTFVLLVLSERTNTWARYGDRIYRPTKIKERILPPNKFMNSPKFQPLKIFEGELIVYEIL